MLFRGIFSGATQGAGNEKIDTSYAECNILCYFVVYFPVPHKVPGMKKNGPLLRGMQFFMLF